MILIYFSPTMSFYFPKKSPSSSLLFLPFFYGYHLGDIELVILVALVSHNVTSSLSLSLFVSLTRIVTL